MGCLTERLIRNSAIEDYPEKDKFQKIHKKEIRQIQAAFSVIEKTYSVKIPISEIGYIYDILAGIWGFSRKIKYFDKSMTLSWHAFCFI